MIPPWFFIHLLPTIGFLLALVLVANLLRERRPPASTIAWLLGIALIPYVGVPLYLMVGGRKIKRMAARKKHLTRSVAGNGSPDIPAPPGLVSVSPGLFPVRGGNDISLLLTGEETYASLVGMIDGAASSIDVTTFILGKDSTGGAILDLLTKKAAEGVSVRLLLDSLGSHAITRRHLARFRDAGGKYAFFMPMLHLPFRGHANLRNHRKMVLVDGATAILGGMNIADEYMGPPDGAPMWRDLAVRVRGEIVDDLAEIFRSDWEFASGERLETPPRSGTDAASGAGIPMQLVPSGPDVIGDPLYDAVLEGIFGVSKRLWIVTPYFIPDEMLMKALLIAAKRGIDVRIVIPRVSNHPLADVIRASYLRELDEAGVTIHLFNGGMLHAKAVIFDDSRAMIGSVNMDVRSFFLNYEIALFIHSAEEVGYLEAWMRSLIRESVDESGESPMLMEIVEGVSRLAAPLL
jgi:cardiolipin synthase A/B